MKLETICLHGGAAPDPVTMSRAVPLHRTSSFVFRDTEHAANLFGLRELGNIYTRLMNPTHDVLEKRVAELEGGAAALALASGTSAIFYTVINLCAAGDEIVSANNLYGGTFTQFHDILPQFGIKVRFVDPKNPENFAKAITPKTKLLFCETVSNPGLDVADLEAIAAIAHKNGIPLVVDATFSTPYLTRPLDHGADIVVHSRHRRHSGGLREVQLELRKISAHDPTRRQLPRRSLGHRHRTALPDCLRDPHARDPAPEPRRLHLARQRLDVPTGHRNPPSPHGAPL